MDENLNARVRALQILVESLIGHLAEEGLLDHQTYDQLWDAYVAAYTPPQ